MQPPIQWVPEAHSLGVKRQGREADHSPPFNAEVKNAWNHTSIPQYSFMAWRSVKKKSRGTTSPYLILPFQKASIMNKKKKRLL
jgi:hypothetical protein